MRQKMINLCPRTFEQASKMENFSQWVRMKLLDEYYKVGVESEYLFRCGCCTLQLVKETRHAPNCPSCTWKMTFVHSELVGTE
jgi:hypothetical protein